MTFLFQFAYAKTATTIVSGAIAERTDFNAFCLFSLVNFIVYCLPAHWMWAPNGFLALLGAVDIAGILTKMFKNQIYKSQWQAKRYIHF